MGSSGRRDDPIWRKAFGEMLKTVFTVYGLDYCDFCEKYYCCEATFRYWQNGDKFPQLKYFPQLKEYFQNNISDDFEKFSSVCSQCKEFLCSQQAEGQYYALKSAYFDPPVFFVEVLMYYRNVAKHKMSPTHLFDSTIRSTGRIQAVVFDFDGTLTKDKINRTTWESLWVDLEYTVKDCQLLHQKFDRNEITHAEWCKLTEDKFKERSLHRDSVEKIASKIHLIKGIRKTFMELRKKDIKIYVVSGSILLVIQSVLGDLCQYVDRIQANQFVFNEAGFLTQIIGTRYDFEGKAHFINEVAYSLNISPRDILFVGNSINDRFAYQSGARTLCINPRLTDPSNRIVWNRYIPSCDDLCEILPYIECDTW